MTFGSTTLIRWKVICSRLSKRGYKLFGCFINLLLKKLTFMLNYSHRHESVFKTEEYEPSFINANLSSKYSSSLCNLVDGGKEVNEKIWLEGWCSVENTQNRCFSKMPVCPILFGRWGTVVLKLAQRTYNLAHDE